MSKVNPVLGILSFSIFVLISQISAAQSFKAENGVLDLRDYPFGERNTLELTGEWEFFWEKFIEPGDSVSAANGFINVPSAWNFQKLNGQSFPAKGYATYRLKILLPKKSDYYAISARAVSSSFILYVNGRRIFSSGKIGKNKESSTPLYSPNLGTFDADTEIEVLVHVSNFRHRLGGMHNTFKFGHGTAVILSKGFKLFSLFFLAGCFLIMALYHIVIFLIIRKDYSPLWFAVFCFIIAIRLMVTDEYVASLYLPVGWSFTMKIEYLTLYGGLITFTGFFSSLFELYINRKITRTIYLILGILAISVVFLPPYYFTRILPFGQVVMVLIALYWFYILFIARRNGNSEALIFMVGFLIVFITAINDILSSNEIIQTPSLIFYGIFAFIAVQAFLMSRKYSLATRKNEILLDRLNEVNRNLEMKVQERTGELENQKENLEEKNTRILIQNEALKKLNTQMDNFVYSVSHDLKAPLASAIGLINLSKNEDDPKTLKHYFEMMEKSLNKLNRFINEILDFSRNARLELNREEIDFEQIINDILEQYQFYEDWKDIKKKVNVKQLSKFISDQQRINIVFNNLVSNALKYSTLGEGEAQVDISVKADSKSAEITISDTGCGIEEEHIEHIFGMFYRADTQKSGSGLGLYIVKETLDKLEGTIKITSKINKGTKISLSIPNLAKDN